MNQNMLLIALVVGALFFLRRPIRANQGWYGSSGQSTYIGTVPGVTGVPGIPGTTGMYGEG
jgi:hypothetical protein